MMIGKTTYGFIITFCIFWLTGCLSTARSPDDQSTALDVKEVSGSFAPTGPPTELPVKIELGKSCLVELTQSYSITGTLTGTMMIDYRILVYGPCGSPAGTFDEDWIAHGTFTGTVGGSSASGNFSYVARVQAGGDVEGQISLGQGLDGELHVQGNFGDGSLSYAGWVR